LTVSQKVEKVCHFERQREIFLLNQLVLFKISPVGRNDNRAIWTFCETIKIESFFEKHKAFVVIKKIGNGYSIYTADDNTPVARLKLTGIKGQAEVLWCGHRNKWDSIGDCGGIVLSLDKALKYVIDDPMGCLWPY